ncbi:MAG: 30S ribosomal protein S9 [Candidatus Altiarchaeales archaeon HGW-Altiarchaeales-3]|nr:MAG: 30S ribosomal protein S9 [Candidatus Altiarchaeales archaeon HGW-Altiarchaeales-3]
MNLKDKVHRPGKKKTAIARTTIRKGRGNIRINSVPLELYEPEVARFKIMEPIILARENEFDLNSIDINTNVHGGGTMGQADAVASSLARSLADYAGEGLLRIYLDYNRVLIAGDHRLTETHKPGQSSKGPRHRRQKSYR